MKKSVLFIDTVHPALENKLNEHGWTCIDGTSWNKKTLISDIGKYTGVVIRSRFRLDQEILSHAHELKFIARAGAGMENIDVPFAHSRKIICINAPEGNRNAVAEHALGMLLALMNNLVVADLEVRTGTWLREENRGVELDGKTIGIIGFGNTGSTFASKLKGFDVEILAYDPYIKIDTSIHTNVMQSEMSSIHSRCDILSLHIPLTEETHVMVNENYFSAFKKPIYFLNTSRGKIVKTDDLVNSIKKGKVKGAALDVLDFESISFENLDASNFPASFLELTKMKNVILSPHVAGWTFESHQKISEVLAAKILNQFS